MALLNIRAPNRISHFLFTFWCFTKARFHEWISYKTSAVLSLFPLVSQVFIFYFMAVALSMFGSEYLDKYGGNYFLFLLVGVTLNYAIIGTVTTSFSHLVQGDTGSGVIETMLTTPTHIITYLLTNNGWFYINRFWRSAVMLGIGLVLGGGFEIDLSFSSVVFGGLLIVLLFISHLSLGLLGGALTIVYKYPGRSIFLTIVNLIKSLCGAYFPIEVMPIWLQLFSRIWPATYALEGIREVFLNNSLDINLIYHDISALFVSCLLLLPIGILSVNMALRSVKKRGTLSVY